MSLPDSFDDSFALFRLVEVHLERVVCAPAWQPCGNDLGGEAVYRVEFLLGLYRGAGHSGEFREQPQEVLQCDISHDTPAGCQLQTVLRLDRRL